MNHIRNKYLLASSMLAMTVGAAWPAAAQSAEADSEASAPSSSQRGRSYSNDVIVVTAQKRAESINTVGMSIDAVSGDELFDKGIIDTADLAKLVPGFTFNETVYGAPIYTIRGIGFQESSLAASPTVSVYVDEVPLPFSAETLGAALDVERVEVLKGPQGTLYGQNSTGGAINYIAAKPTDEFSAGVNASVGRFSTVNLSGFVSGALTSTLKTRLSVGYIYSDDWQESVSRPGDELGGVDRLTGRLLTEWTPVDALKITVNVNGWRDKSDTPAQQLAGLAPQLPFLPAEVLALTPVPAGDARAADWDPDTSFERDNYFYQGSVRGDLSLAGDITITSITSYQKYHRDMPVDADATQYPVFFVDETGEIETIFQELRVSGPLGDGHWILGANYQSDKTEDSHYIDFTFASTGFLGGSLVNENSQDIKTKAIYASIDYPVYDGLSIQGGVRYTDADREYAGCARDPGNGGIAGAFGSPPGECFTILDGGGFGVVYKELNEDNISWRAGLNYQVNPDILLYANVSKGFKAGSFPILSALVESQVTPVVQESLLAYEAGFKAVFGPALQITGAGFYYDYQDKQIRGLTLTPLGLGETLINIPESHVVGFELSGVVRPFEGLSISPSVTMVQSEIDGSFSNYTGLFTLELLSGEPFPYTPKWQGNTDVEYRFPVAANIDAFLGGNIIYQTGTYGAFGEEEPFDVDGYTTVDLRAGFSDADGRWSVSAWGRNITNRYYLETATRSNDTLGRIPGMPATYGVSLTYRYN